MVCAPAPVEPEAREADFREHRRQPTRCTDVEVHRIAVEQEHAAADRSVLRHVERAVERRRVGRDRDQFGAYRGGLLEIVARADPPASYKCLSARPICAPDDPSADRQGDRDQRILSSAMALSPAAMNQMLLSGPAVMSKGTLFGVGVVNSPVMAQAVLIRPILLTLD